MGNGDCKAKKYSPIQLALAWVQHKGAVTVLGYYGAFALWGWGGLQTDTLLLLSFYTLI